MAGHFIDNYFNYLYIYYNKSEVFYLCFFSVAMQQVLDNLTDLPSSSGAEEIDLIFLKGIMENPIVKSLAKV